VRNIRLVLSYDGTHFNGWQAQPGHVRTVAGELGRAITQVTGESPRLVAAGRTDRGAHSLGQTVSFALAGDVSPERLLTSLSVALPHDIEVNQSDEVPQTFHARFSARRRRYRYLLDNRPVGNPPTRAHAWHVKERLDIAAMRGAAMGLLGKRDLRVFGADPAGRNTVRNLQDVSVRRLPAGEEELVAVDLCADAFLYGMVRRIVGFLVEVGLHRRAAAEVSSIVRNGRMWTGRVAPAVGLYQLAPEY
jgi:tRNA pseudouridine38-40 synthase